MQPVLLVYIFFFNDTATTEIYTLSLHDALPIRARRRHRPLLDRHLDRPADDVGGWACALRKALDQIVGDGFDLVLRDRHFHVRHHAHDGVPALGRVADLEPVDVMTGTAHVHDGLLPGSLRKIRSRLLRVRWKRKAEQGGARYHKRSR